MGKLTSGALSLHGTYGGRGETSFPGAHPRRIAGLHGSRLQREAGLMRFFIKAS